MSTIVNDIVTKAHNFKYLLHEDYFLYTVSIIDWLYEQSGFYPNQLVFGGSGTYLDKAQKKSYIIYDRGNFVIVNYFDHKTQEKTSKRFNKNGTGTSTRIKRQPSRPIQPTTPPQLLQKQQCHYDAKQFYNWSTTPNRAFNYLKRKGLEKEAMQLIADGQLRFGSWQDGKHKGDWLAFLIESAIDGKSLGVQRIFEDGTKINSKGLDKSQIPCIWLGHNLDAEPVEFNVCEGIATAMSVMAAKGTAISAIDAGNLPKEIEIIYQRYLDTPIYVYADNDEAGHKAVQKCSHLIKESFFPAQEGKDWNDILVDGGIDEIHRQISRNQIILEDEETKPANLKHQWLTAEQGTELLEESIWNCFKKTNYNEVTVIAASAGIGKSTSVLKELRRIKNISNLQSGTTFYFVPNHKLAEELNKKALDIGLRSTVRKGRTHEGMCQKVEVVEALGEKGIKRVLKILCCDKKSDEQCEHYNQCPYIQQYHQIIDPDLVILSHEYLALDYSELEYELKIFPKRIVIDESFYQKLIKDTSVPLSLIIENNKIPEKVKEALTLATTLGRPFLKMLRDHNVTSSDLRKILTNLNKSEKAELNITPSMSIEAQLQRITLYDGNKKTGTIKIILEKLAEELDQLSDCQHSIRVHSYKDKSGIAKIVCNHLLPISRIKDDPQNRRPNPHILVIDADADKEIMQRIFPDMEINFINIPVKRNAEIIQINNALISSEYNGSNTNSERYARGQNYFEAMKSIGKKLDGKTLIVSMSNVEARIKAEIEDIDTEHFGNIRGQDKYKDYDNIICYGYFQPPVYTIENEARALFWNEANSDEDFILDGQMENQLIKYQGTEKSAEIRMHRNPYVNICLRQHRECEIQQSIDRLRLIHCKEKKKVFILTKLPLPNVEITELMSLKKVVATVTGEPLPTTRDERIIAQTLNGNSGVLPFSVDVLHTLLSEEFKTAKSAERWRENLLKSVERNNPHDVYNILYTRWGLFDKVTYYEYSIGKGKDKYCLSRHDERTTQSILEKWHNKTVVVKLSIVVSPHKAPLPNPKNLTKLEEVKVPQFHNPTQITQFPKETLMPIKLTSKSEKPFVWRDLMTEHEWLWNYLEKSEIK